MLPDFDFILPKFHLIIPKFHFTPRWRIFVFHGAVGDFLGEELSGGHGNRAINDKKRGDLPSGCHLSYYLLWLVSEGAGHRSETSTICYSALSRRSLRAASSSRSPRVARSTLCCVAATAAASRTCWLRSSVAA